jgi:hypothetical protein
MSSANGSNDIKCTGVGYLPWRAPNGDIIFIKCFYSDKVTDTIISPSNIVLNNITKFNTWIHHANMATNEGYIKFTNTGSNFTITYPLVCLNGL